MLGYWRNRVLSGILKFRLYSAFLAVLITFRNDRMPHSASAKKRLRQNVRSRDRNKAMKTEIKTSIRKVLEALSEKDVSTANDLFKLVAKKADQAATSKTIHKNRLLGSSRDFLPASLKPLSQRLAKSVRLKL